MPEALFATSEVAIGLFVSFPPKRLPAQGPTLARLAIIDAGIGFLGCGH